MAEDQLNNFAVALASAMRHACKQLPFPISRLDWFSKDGYTASLHNTADTEV